MSPWSIGRSIHGAPFFDRVVVDIGSRRVPSLLAGSGAPLLLLHGYPLDATMWLPAMAHLAQHFLCIAPDLRGFGDAAEERFSFTLNDLAADCLKLLDRLTIGQPIILCGLSMGGYIAMEFMEHFGDRARAAILTNTKGTVDEPAARANRIAVAARVLIDGTEQTVAPMLSKLIGRTGMDSNPAMVQCVRDMMVRTRPSTVAWAQLAMAQRSDSLSRMLGWSQPVLCISGDEDQLTPPNETARMARQLANGTVATIERAGHLSPIEQPQTFARIVAAFVVDVDR